MYLTTSAKDKENTPENLEIRILFVILRTYPEPIPGNIRERTFRTG